MKTPDSEADNFEGCTKDGPIRGIFIGEFHHTAGPKVLVQVPEEFISKDVFDTVSVYIIPKAQLQRSIMTVSLTTHKILGYPVMVKNKRYMRNEFYFNLCFVFDVWSRSIQYEPVVKKLAEFLLSLEEKEEFLSKPRQPDQVQLLLYRILSHLNEQGTCILSEGRMISFLKVIKIPTDPPQVRDHEVPIFLPNQQEFRAERWDLTTRQIYPFIDGFNHIACISHEADVEINLVKACVQNLLYYGVVAMLPIFLYRNIYVVNPCLRRLATDPELQQRCINYVSLYDDHPATLKNIFRFYASLNSSNSFKELCLRMNPRQLNIDERKLIQFGLLESIVRRIYKYPIVVKSPIKLRSNGNDDLITLNLRHFFNGKTTLEEICCLTNINMRNLEELLEKDPEIKILLK